MKFNSEIPKEELLSLYSRSLLDVEKNVISALLGLGINPDDFEIADLDAVEARLPENDEQNRDRVRIVREQVPLMELIDKKIQDLK